MISRKKQQAILFLASVIILLSASFWTWISFDFVYGENHTERPIIPFVVSYLVAWLAFVCVFILKKRGIRLGIPMILTVGFLARLVLIPSDLIQENDVYRYVLDGQVLLSGGNPYEFSPDSVTDIASPALRESLRNPNSEIIISRIGYPGIPTIYPPAAQVTFAFGVLLSDWDWIGMRIVFLLFDLSVIGLLIYFLRLKQLDLDWLFLYAWNPLVLKEIINSAHLDVATALSILGALTAFLLFERSGKIRFVILAAGLVGLSVLLKIYPILLLPTCCFAILRNRRSLFEVVLFLVVSGSIITIGYIPFIEVGYERLVAGLLAFSKLWRMNEGFYGLLSTISIQSRWLTAALIAAVSVAVPLLRKTRDLSLIGNDFFWVLLLWFLLIPTPFPWYAVPICAVAAANPNRFTTSILVVLAGALGLYYLSFFYEYHFYPNNWWTNTKIVEHSLIWGTILWSIVKTPKVFCSQPSRNQ